MRLVGEWWHLLEEDDFFFFFMDPDFSFVFNFIGV